MKTKDEVMELLRSFFRNPDDLNSWLDFPHPSLGDRTPRSVMEEEGGPHAVFTLVDSINTGGGL